LVFLDVQNRKLTENEEMDHLKGHHHVPLPMQDEDESEVSFDDHGDGLLDRLGVKIDDSLHEMFTAYVFLF